VVRRRTRRLVGVCKEIERELGELVHNLTFRSSSTIMFGKQVFSAPWYLSSSTLATSSKCVAV
jgi:hypothetical protein